MKMVMKNPSGWYAAVYKPGEVVPKNSFILVYRSYEQALRVAEAWRPDMGGLERAWLERPVKTDSFEQWAKVAGLSAQDGKHELWAAVLSYDGEPETNELGLVAP